MGNIISSGAEISEKKDSHPEREKKENIWHETSNKDHGKAGEEIAFEEEPEN